MIVFADTNKLFGAYFRFLEYGELQESSFFLLNKASKQFTIITSTYCIQELLNNIEHQGSHRESIMRFLSYCGISYIFSQQTEEYMQYTKDKDDAQILADCISCNAKILRTDNIKDFFTINIENNFQIKVISILGTICTNRKKAITLIEVLISIAIFSIGILSISYLIINNVGLSERTRLKTTATMLAKEGIELVYNRRDTNIKKGWLWNCLALKQGSYAGECETFFHNPNNLNTSTSRTLQIDENGGYGFNLLGSALDNDKLYPVKSTIGKYTLLKSWGAKNNIIGQKVSSFRRRITFTPVILGPEGGASQAGKLLKVTSTVTYKKSAYSGSVSLQSFIGDTLDTIPLDYYR